MIINMRANLKKTASDCHTLTNCQPNGSRRTLLLEQNVILAARRGQ